METALRGLVCSFRPENGFGTLELEDGREVAFDVTACVEEPLEGQAVRVVLGEARDGGTRAVLVEPENVPTSTRPPSSLADAIRRLQSEGLALELDAYEVEQITRREGLPGALPSDLAPLLSFYYRHDFVGARRCQTDQFVQWRDGDDVAAFERNLAQLISGDAITFAGGEVNVRSIDDVVDAFNEELRAQGDARRVVPLQTHDDARAYYCMALSRAMRLSASGVLIVRWDRPHLTPSEPPPKKAC